MQKRANKRTRNKRDSSSDKSPPSVLDPTEKLLVENVEVLPADAEPSTDAKDLPLSDSKEITTYDPLRIYLKEISRYPMLTKEEERELAQKVFEHKDREAAYKLITSHLWLAVKVARDYERAAKNLMDLIQEGNIGLMEAVKNFDPYREVRFPSYAVWWIKAYIIRYIMANWRLVKIGTTQAQRKLFFNLKKEKDRLEREGFFPSPKLLAEKLSVKESEIVEMEQRLGSSDMSVDAPLSDEGESTTLLSMLASENASAEELLDQKQSQALIKKSINNFKETLNEKEYAIFEERLLGEEKATLNDLAERFKLSRERIRQLESRVKDKFRDYMLEQGFK